MEQLKNVLEEKINAWSSPAWSNKEIMLCLGVKETLASQIHQEAKRHKGLFKGKYLKTKVKSDVVCEIMGIDRNKEIKKLLECLSLVREKE